MNDAGLVRRLERLGDLRRDRQGVVERDRSLRDPLLQGLPVDQLQHERARAALLLDAVDLRDVRMIEGREQLGFPLEAGQAVGIAGKGVREDLQRDGAVQSGVATPVDLAHAARAKDAGNLEVPREPIPGGHCGFRNTAA